ncbi:MAG: hypothetical protein LBH72_07260 [Proteiniphilum sp.]|jgi:hypothetical protein|nr:hypothetical protein [Proteiniphilum sp.]
MKKKIPKQIMPLPAAFCLLLIVGCKTGGKQADDTFTGNIFAITVNREFYQLFHSAEELFLIRNFPKESGKNVVLEAIASEMTEDDNPVIFFNYFKKINQRL